MFRLIVLLLIVCLPAGAQDAQRFSPRNPLTTTAQPPPLQIYISVNGEQVGPLDVAGFHGHLGTPEAAASTFVWIPGMSDWALASTVPALQSVIASMGQSATGEMTPPSDPASFMLGLWISEPFKWKMQDVEHSAIVHVKLLPDGRFEGATIYREADKPEGDIRISLEKGTWNVAAEADGKFSFSRNIIFTNVVNGEALNNGQFEDKFVFKATGPDNALSDENIDFVRVSESE